MKLKQHYIKDIKYLEVSGRRSGKTTRMQNQARVLIQQGRDIGILCIRGILDSDLVKYQNKEADVMLVDEFDYKPVQSEFMRVWNKESNTSFYIYGTPIGDNSLAPELTQIHPMYFKATNQMLIKDDSLSCKDYEQEFLGEF